MVFTRWAVRTNLWLGVAALIGSILVASGSTTATANTLVPMAVVGVVPGPPPGAVAIGTLPSGTPLRVIVALKPRNPVALARFAAEVSAPGSPYYRHYLPRGVFPHVFGPTQHAIHSVEAALRRAGLPQEALSPGHLAITITATARAVEHAFTVRLKRYRLAGGRLAYANTTPARFPASAAAYVQAVLGLDDLYPPQPAGLQPVPSGPRLRGRLGQAGTGGPQPTCRTAGGETANRVASAYNFSALYAAGDYGAKKTVGLIELAPNLKSDISGYEKCYSLNGKPLTTTVNYIKVAGAASVGKGANPEPTFDIEDVIGLAPKATIAVYQGGPETVGAIYTDEQYAVAEDAAQVLSISYGECEPDDAYASAENTVFEQAAVQGQSVLVASGDWGSEDCTAVNRTDKTLEVLDPASQPYVTGVGGTVLLKPGPPPSEITWNDCQGQPTSCAAKPCGTCGASGGGISTLWPMPSYQRDAPSRVHVISPLSSTVQRCPGAGPGHYCREVPDVSANAGSGRAGISGGGGYAGYINGSWQYFAGTSFAAPLWAAGLALIDEKSGDIGFANPALYAIAGSPAYATAFHDMTSGNNDYTDTHHGDYPAGTGYDMATGLGTPNFGGLATATDLLVRSWAPQAAAEPANAAQLDFRGVSCTSATACAAVGSYFDTSGGNHLLAETWNGTRWSIDQTPSPAGSSASEPITFSGVSCTSAGSCTAVGSYTQAGDSRTLAETWNGSTWSLRSTPNPAGTTQNSLLGVSCVTRNYCVAAGSTSAGPGTPLAENWNGTKWSLISTPSLGASTGSFNAVSCTDSNACIAVGADGKGTLAEHWDGTKWGLQTTPHVTTQYPPQLRGVSCTGPAACTAVGSDLQTPFAESWNGTSWKLHPTPIKTFYFNIFGSVSCATSADLCTAVGSYVGDGQGASDFGYAVYWDGKSWTLESADRAHDFSETLNSVSCISPTVCVAVGSGILTEGR